MQGDNSFGCPSNGSLHLRFRYDGVKSFEGA
jgi:hypothetical protein